MTLENKIKLHVGIDDTDSNEGMCTTYVTCIIINKLKKLGIVPLDYPKLIRLNPFARYKTRGNGALSFVVELNSQQQIDEVKKIVLDYVDKYAMFDGVNTNPGVVFYQGEVTSIMKQYAIDAIYNILTIDYAEHFAQKIGAEIHKFKKGRGIIGSIAAIACELPDETFEFLAYRLSENYGTKRKLNEDSIKLMNDKTYPMTFDNVDGKYAAIEPHTPCPVLYGIRGNTPDIVEKAHFIVESYEEIENYCIFRTNQHTDMHIQQGIKIKDMTKYNCYCFDCIISEEPHDIKGGHVFFKVTDGTGILELAAFEPTKTFRDVVRKLKLNDKLTVYGGINENNTFNVEKFKLREVAKSYKYVNPLCTCGKRMKSAGKNKGFKCSKCGERLRDGTKQKIELQREISEGFYEVPISARRHLSKPIIRITTLADKKLT